MAKKSQLLVLTVSIITLVGDFVSYIPFVNVTNIFLKLIIFPLME